jgi:hypothetical protein
MTESLTDSSKLEQYLSKKFKTFNRLTDFNGYAVKFKILEDKNFRDNNIGGIKCLCEGGHFRTANIIIANLFLTSVANILNFTVNENHTLNLKPSC